MSPRTRTGAPRSRRQYVQPFKGEAHALARAARGARTGKFPGFVEPALATLAPQSPKGKRWLHEIKYDGYRFQCHIHQGIRLYTRRGYDWTAKVPAVARALAPLTSHFAILDGEIVVPTPEGRSDFHALERALKAEDGSDRLIFYVFDLLYLDAFDLRAVAFVDRKRILAKLLEPIGGPVRLSEHLEGDGPTIWKRGCALELEGIVSKISDGHYVSGRTNTWIKATCRHRDTFAVVGWAQKNGRFDGIYLGRQEEGELVYAGKLERGFSEQDKRAMLERLSPLRVRKRPMAAARKTFPKARWVRPSVLVDAEFRGKTGAGLLRHPSFKGVREDLAAG